MSQIEKINDILPFFKSKCPKLEQQIFVYFTQNKVFQIGTNDISPFANKKIKIQINGILPYKIKCPKLE